MFNIFKMACFRNNIAKDLRAGAYVLFGDMSCYLYVFVVGVVVFCLFV